MTYQIVHNISDEQTTNYNNTLIWLWISWVSAHAQLGQYQYVALKLS